MGYLGIESIKVALRCTSPKPSRAQPRRFFLLIERHALALFSRARLTFTIFYRVTKC